MIFNLALLVLANSTQAAEFNRCYIAANNFVAEMASVYEVVAPNMQAPLKMTVEQTAKSAVVVKTDVNGLITGLEHSSTFGNTAIAFKYENGSCLVDKIDDKTKKELLYSNEICNLVKGQSDSDKRRAIGRADSDLRSQIEKLRGGYTNRELYPPDPAHIKDKCDKQEAKWSAITKEPSKDFKGYTGANGRRMPGNGIHNREDSQKSVGNPQ